MMVGNDLRLMTPIMKELLLNEEAIAITQDYEATPGDAMPGCKNASDQLSSLPQCTCKTFGPGTNPSDTAFCEAQNLCLPRVAGCTAPLIECTPHPSPPPQRPPPPSPPAQGDVWVRRLTGGDLAVAMVNYDKDERELSICLDALAWAHGNTAKARNVWRKQDLGTFSQKFSAKVASHDTLLLRLSPA